MTNKPLVASSDGVVETKTEQTALLTAIFYTVLSIFVTFLLIEGAFRLGIALKVDYFLDPSIYSYPFHDNYWKLSYRWHQQGSETNSSNLNPDPFLGWSPQTSPENPLGLIGMGPYEPNHLSPVVLFYGDSFVAGKTAQPQDNIPNQLAERLPDTAVYNYGVSNFGVDQIYLRLLQSHESFAQPTIVVGIFTLDMDRSMISLRSGAPKPYFTLSNEGALILHGINNVPVNTTSAEWLSHWHTENPPRIGSYAWAFITKRLDSFRTGGDWLSTTQSQAEIEALNGRLIQEMVTVAQERDLPIEFVIFYSRREMDTTYWRETFLKEHLTALNVPFLDSKQLILEKAETDGTSLNTYFMDDGGHTNEIGNRVIAEALAARLLGK